MLAGLLRLAPYMARRAAGHVRRRLAEQRPPRAGEGRSGGRELARRRIGRAGGGGVERELRGRWCVDEAGATWASAISRVISLGATHRHGSWTYTAEGRGGASCSRSREMCLPACCAMDKKRRNLSATSLFLIAVVFDLNLS
jgi:hypothetical protein